MDVSPTGRNVVAQVALYVYNQRGSGLPWLFCRVKVGWGGEQDYCCYNFICLVSWKIHQFFNLSAKETGGVQMLVVAVGRMLSQPRQQCKDVGVSCIYIYIYIYLYICFSFPSLFSGTVRHSWDASVELENPDEGLFFMVLALGWTRNASIFSQEVRIPKARGRGVVGREEREMQRKEEDKKS